MRPTAGIVAALMKYAPPDLRMVVIDSARGLLTADGGEEDRSDDVRRTLGAVAKWQADHGADVAVVAIHHMRRDREAKTGDRTRGSGDWLACVDLVIEFDQTASGAKLTYSGRTGAPSAPLFLAWVDGRFMPGRPDAPVEPAGGDTATKKRTAAARLDPDGWIWPDPKIDDPMRAWIVANRAANGGSPPAWAQCRKRIRQEATIEGRNDALKDSYDRVIAWLSGGPQLPNPGGAGPRGPAGPASGPVVVPAPVPLMGTTRDRVVPIGRSPWSPSLRGPGTGTGYGDRPESGPQSGPRSENGDRPADAATDEDMPAGALDCYASGADQGPPPRTARPDPRIVPPPPRPAWERGSPSSPSGRRTHPPHNGSVIS